MAPPLAGNRRRVHEARRGSLPEFVSPRQLPTLNEVRLRPFEFDAEVLQPVFDAFSVLIAPTSLTNDAAHGHRKGGVNELTPVDLPVARGCCHVAHHPDPQSVLDVELLEVAAG